ncbi:MAG: AAA family ATPase, partial [Atribacterota bacterium]|nr:AAA family ATPase [Atribacterota bacterium]
MRIDSLRLKPFAGIIERKVDFSSGLNIILGPNEAGKSTLLNALEAVLFTPVSLTKSKYEKLIKNYLPANGGNVIRVHLDFQVAGKVFRLEKEWKETGKGGTCIFKSDGGSEYTGDEKVSELIKQYFPAEEGTIRNVLLTWQSSLDRTKDIFDGNGRDVRSDLGNILRSSIMETDGISVDELKEKLELEYKQY